MKKKLWFIFALLSVLLFASCTDRKKTDNGDRDITKHVKVCPFKRIKMETVCHVYFEQADTVGVRIVGKQHAVKRIKAISDGTTLTINRTSKDRWLNINNSTDVDIYITSPDLISVLMRGAGDFDIEKHLDTDTLSVRLEGAGDIEIDDLICDEVFVQLKGAGDIDLKKVIASKAAVSLRGVGDVKVHLERCDWAQSELEGIGDITLSGRVKRFRHKIRGTGTVNTDRLRILSEE